MAAELELRAGWGLGVAAELGFAAEPELDVVSQLAGLHAAVFLGRRSIHDLVDYIVPRRLYHQLPANNHPENPQTECLKHTKE